MADSTPDSMDEEYDYFAEFQQESSDTLTTVYSVDKNKLSCIVLYVKVVCGRNVTKGSNFQNYIDEPDPYVTLNIPLSPQETQRTSAIDNEVNPVWEETFRFYLNTALQNEIKITLVDANYTIDEYLASKNVDLSVWSLQKERIKLTVVFDELIRDGKHTELDLEFWGEQCQEPKLRYSFTICDEEKAYRTRRRQRIYDVMQEILGEDAPQSLSEVPTIGVLGSGGGFRAMTSFCGVMSGLYETRILDMIMYNVGLSGSSWYLSTLYSHPEWPEKSPKELRTELRDSIQRNPWWLSLCSIYRNLRTILKKKREGQPVSFTDLFGNLIGEMLLKNRTEAKLTDQQLKIKDGEIPMPMYTCLHVKKTVSALNFHEWMEFSPYEIGMPKYGTFMKPEFFGSKFFMGHLIKKHEEPPLRFLQGIWGSAFCIQLRHLLLDKKVYRYEMIEKVRTDLETELVNEMSTQDESESSDTSEDEDYEQALKSRRRKQSKNYKLKFDEKSGHPVNVTSGSGNKNKNGGSFWTSVLHYLLDCHPMLQTIRGRAATVHNYMRGLSFYKACPFSPLANNNTTKSLEVSTYFSKNLLRRSTESSISVSTGCEDADQFDGIFEMYPTSIKKLYVVDGGLSFNSPYPLLLRPQRAVDIILSFDFTARPTDWSPPFKELVLAMEWAKLNRIPFPDIDPTVLDREGLKECYVFSNPNDPSCPVVLHFVLVNITFRDEKKPGVRRRAEERDYADFDIFNEGNNTYSTFNFQYTNKAFDRLADLMEFNTVLHKDLIIDTIKSCVQKLRRYNACYRRSSLLEELKLGPPRKSKKKI